MRFVLNTRFTEMAASRVCISHLGQLLKERNYSVSYNDWDHYDRYDVVIFMSYDCEVAKARAGNPHIKIGIGDPKPYQVGNVAREVDFLLVSSLEQRDLFMGCNPNAIVYYMFPEVPMVPRQHVNKDKIVIAYHGAKVHLHAMYPRITGALEALGKEMPVEFRAIYNISSLGKWKVGVPNPKYVKTKHCQWAPDKYAEYLSDADIGINPNSTMVSHYESRRWSFQPFGYAFGLNHGDYLIRYKFSSNPGRIYVFSQFGIPVVSDFYPSAAQFLEYGKRGFLAHSMAGWYHAMRALALAPELRQSFSDNLRDYIEANASPKISIETLLRELPRMSRQPTFDVVEPRSTLVKTWLRFYGEYLFRGNKKVILLLAAFRKLRKSLSFSRSVMES